jgi:hypothetical protein
LDSFPGDGLAAVFGNCYTLPPPLTRLENLARNLIAMAAQNFNRLVRWRLAMFTVLLTSTIFGFAALVRHVCAAETQRVAVTPGRGQQVISLRDRLVVGLQARLKSEVEFVEQVVAKVRTGKLPQHVVDETFFWARDRASISRNGSRRRPIIFFQPAMTMRAKKLRVDL